MYDLAVHCALVEVPPVPGGGLKRILSSSPSLSRSRFNQRLRSSGCKNQLLPHPCALVGPSAAMAAGDVMELGEDDASLGWLGRGRGAVGRAVGVLKLPRMGWSQELGARQREALGWQHLAFRRQGLSQACYSRFQTDVKHNNTPSGVSPVHQFHVLLLFPLQKAAAHMICLHSLQKVHSCCTVYSGQPLLHSPAQLCPAARAGFSPQPHPLCCPWLFLSALPPPWGMISQPCSTKPWGFLCHHSSQRGAFPSFPRSPKHQLSFLRKKRGRNISRRVTVLSMSCIAHALAKCTTAYLHLPRGPALPKAPMHSLRASCQHLRDNWNK